MSQQEKRPRQTFFAGVEKLIHQVRQDPGIPGEQVSDKNVREDVFLVDHAHHFFPLDSQYGAPGHRRRRCHTLRLNAGYAILPNEVAWAKQRDSSFLAFARNHRELGPPLLDVIDGFTYLSLGKDLLVLGDFNDRSADAGLGEKHLGLKLLHILGNFDDRPAHARLGEKNLGPNLLRSR